MGAVPDTAYADAASNDPALYTAYVYATPVPAPPVHVIDTAPAVADAVATTEPKALIGVWVVIVVDVAEPVPSSTVPVTVTVVVTVAVVDNVKVVVFVPLDDVVFDDEIVAVAPDTGWARGLGASFYTFAHLKCAW